MTDTPAKPVLLTGASGALGRVLVEVAGALGWTLRLTDIAPFPDAVPAGATFTRADLNDGVTMLRLAEGCGAIMHLGGVSVERPFEEVIGPNIRGLYHIYEAARREKARVIFASSNHSIGFHERTESARRRHPVPAGRVLRAVEGVWRADGPDVLVQAWGGERLRPHRVVLPGAGECADAGDLAVVSGLLAAGGALRADAEGRPCGDLGRVEQRAHDVVARRRARRSWAGRRPTAPIRLPASWRARSAAIRSRNATWAARIARSIFARRAGAGRPVRRQRWLTAFCISATSAIRPGRCGVGWR